APEVAADPAEAVHADPSGHAGLLGAVPAAGRRVVRAVRDVVVVSKPSGCPRWRELPARPGLPVDGPRTYGPSMSGVTLASVSGTPRSAARLSASASSRRIRPATAAFVIGGAASWASPPSRGRLWSRRKR